MHENLINKFINEGRFNKLGPAFKTSIQKYNYKTIIPPFDQIFKAHIFYTKNRTFFNSLEVLKTSCILLDYPDKETTAVLYKFIIKNCMSHNTNENETKSLAKVLLEIYKNTKYYVITNILLKLYFKIQNYELAYNFLLITSNNRKNKKDFFIYNLYKSVLLLYKDDLEGANECINIAYRSKNVRKDGHVLFFIINLIFNKPVKTTNTDLLKLKETIQLGLYTHVYDVLDNMNHLLHKYNIYAIVKTYLPLVCFANLIKRLFYLKNEDYKLDMKYLLKVIDLKYEEVISLICSVIESNLIKGYMSINKNIMVFSKKDPFPLYFNQ